VADVTEPMTVLGASPARVMRVAVFVGVAGLACLLVAVGVLVWTVVGVNRQTTQADRLAIGDVSAPTMEPAKVVVPAPAPAPVPSSVPPAPSAAPAAPVAAPSTSSAGGNSEILKNPALAAIAPTAQPSSSGAVPNGGIPAVAWPNGNVPNVDWNAVGNSLGLQNGALPALIWARGGGGAATGAIISAAVSVGNNAFNFVGNNAFDVLNTLILANSGVYGGGNPATSAVNTLTRLPSVGLPQLPAPPRVGLPRLPAPPKVGLPAPPKVGLPAPPKIGPPKIGLPAPPKLPSVTRMIGLPF
jgi:hypothetical protein